MNKLFSNLGLGKSCSVQLEFLPTDGETSIRKTIVKGKRGEKEELPLFSNKDTIRGTVKIIPIPGKRVEHLGVRVQLLGQIELATEKSHPHEFLSLVRDLSPPGEIISQQSLPFEFKSVEMEYESYRGSQVRLRYSVRVIIARSMGQSLIQDYFFEVQNPIDVIPPSSDSIQMEVGIEDCLHIEFEYGRSAYHLRDIVIGKINFLLVRIKLKHMELEIKRRETVGGGINARLESTTVAKFEIMDGAPARGESIPIRLYLSPYPLTPSYPNVHNKFGVKYSINLVLVDEEDRRYFKQQDIQLFRLRDDEADNESNWNFISGSMKHHIADKESASEEAQPQEEEFGQVDEEESMKSDGMAEIQLDDDYK